MSIDTISQQSGSLPYDERDREIERIVDTRGVSYNEARMIYGEPPEPPMESLRVAADTETPLLPYHGPFRKDIYDLHEDIRQAELRSQLAASKFGLRMARLALVGRASGYDIAATEEIRRRRIGELTHGSDGAPE